MAVSELYMCIYIYIYIVRTSVTLHGSMDINAKYSFVHSHAWTTGRSNLSNCKFTLVFERRPARIADISLHVRSLE